MPIKRDEYIAPAPKPKPVAAKPKSERKSKEQPQQGSVPKDWKPPYIRWFENDFWADPEVNRGMNCLQRHYYRALLCAAFFCETRPYLPDDDNKLARLADAESLQSWKDNREAIMVKFTAVTTDDGRKLLRNKRVATEWDHVVDVLQKSKKAGHASARARAANARSTDVKHTFNERSTDVYLPEPEPETEPESLTESESISVTEPESVNRVSVSAALTRANQSFSGSGSGSGSGSAGVDRELEAEELNQDWIHYRKAQGFEIEARDCENSEFLQLLKSGEAADEIRQVLAWLPISDYWDQPGKGLLKGPAGFRRAYQAIRKSYDSYNAKARKNALKDFDPPDTETSMVDYLMDGGE